MPQQDHNVNVFVPPLLPHQKVLEPPLLVLQTVFSGDVMAGSHNWKQRPDGVSQENTVVDLVGSYSIWKILWGILDSLEEIVYNF